MSRRLTRAARRTRLALLLGSLAIVGAIVPAVASADGYDNRICSSSFCIIPNSGIPGVCTRIDSRGAVYIGTCTYNEDGELNGMQFYP
jgi:hypothetical protein